MKTKKTVKKVSKKSPPQSSNVDSPMSLAQIDAKIAELKRHRDNTILLSLIPLKKDSQFLALKKEYNSLIKKIKSYKFPSFKITPIIFDCDESLEYFDGGSMFFDTNDLDEQLEKIKEQLDDLFSSAFFKDVKLLFKNMGKLSTKYNIDVYYLEDMLRDIK